MRVKLFGVLLIGLILTGMDLFASAGQNPDPKTIGWRKDKKMAKKLLKKGDADAAMPYLEAGATKKPKKKFFPENLAIADFKARDYRNANKWWKVLVNMDSVKQKHPAYIYQYALTLKYLGQYEQAMAYFARFKKLAKDDDEGNEMKRQASRESQGCEKGIFFRDSVPNPAFKVKLLDANINQPSSDYSPKLRDGALYYSTMRGDSGHVLSRIFKSMKQGRGWANGDMISDDINVSGQQVGNPAFTQDGSTMYYTLCQPAEMHTSKCQIYFSKIAEGVWGKGQSIGAAVNDPLYSNTEPAVGQNKDGEDVLYFASDRNPGKGMDLFSAKLNPDGTAGKPRSVGPMINTKGDEATPYFDFKTKTLYFSSNGQINIGGMDVYKATWDANGEWMEPENLGMPVNSSVDDKGFYINERNTFGFMVSNRAGGFGLKSETCCDDIYQVETTHLFLAVKGNAYEEKDGNREPASSGLVVLYDEHNGTEMGSYNLINGGFFFDLEPKRYYKLLLRKDNCYDAVSSFNTMENAESDTMKYDLFLKHKPEPVNENPLIGRTIGRIYYDYDQSKLRPDARDSLRKIMDILNQFPNMVVEVGAHTDGKGTEDYNLALSKRRAEAATNYYIYEKKVNRNRLVPKWYGTSQPVAPNTTPDGKDNPEGRAQNRRTEFKFVGELKAEQLKAEVNAMPPANVVKKDIAPAKKTTSVKTLPPAKPGTVNNAAPAPAGYKTAPSEHLEISGRVYLDKGGNRSPVNQAAVFLSSNEGGFTQKVFYVKGDGTYNFDLSRSTADTFKLIARKYTFESDEIVFTPAQIKNTTAPIDLVIKVK